MGVQYRGDIMMHVGGYLEYYGEAYKTNSTVICVPCVLEHVFYEPFSLKNCRFGRYLMLIG